MPAAGLNFSIQKVIIKIGLLQNNKYLTYFTFLWWTDICTGDSALFSPFQWEEERMFQGFLKSNALGWVILQHLLNEVKEILVVRIMAGHEFLHE